MWRMAMAGVFLVLIQTQSHPTIDVGEDRLLSVDGPARPLAESQLSLDPSNPKHLLVGVIQFDSPDGNDRTCLAWTSIDGGREWVRLQDRSRRRYLPQRIQRRSLVHHCAALKVEPERCHSLFDVVPLHEYET